MISCSFPLKKEKQKEVRGCSWIRACLVFQADVDGNGTIDYLEFITATMHLNRMEREDHLYKAFEYFDKDKSG